MAYRVTKPIPKGDGSTIPSGTLVDAKGWRNLRTLINGRYLVEVVDAIPSKPAPKPAPVVVPQAEVQSPVVEEEKPRPSRRTRKRDEDGE